jgi:hypothetical protein
MSMRFKGGVISATPPATTTSKGVWTLTQQMQAAGGGVWPTVPGAPTSVSATAGNASATVTFVAPSYTGYPAGITGYLATSNPGSFTATGASSPLTVTGLTNGTAYTIAVQATNGVGYGPAGTSGSVTPSNPYYIGVLKPASGDYYLQGYIYNAANTDGMFLAGGDTSGGRIQKLNYTGSIAFQNFITVSGGTPYFTAAHTASSGNIYTGGRINTGFGSGPWITKYDSGGSVTWSRGVGFLAYDTYAVTTDSSENIYYTGRKNTGTFDVSQRLIVGSLNSSGTDRWQTECGTGTSGVGPAGISTNGTSVFAAGIWYNPSYSRQGVFLKLAQSNGALQLEQIYSAYSSFNSLVQSASGNCYIGAGLISPSRNLILKTDSSGTKQWGTTINTGNDDVKVAIDSSENVYALSTGNNVASRTLVISKYNSSGTIQWQRNLTTPSGTEIASNISIAVTASGNIFISTQLFFTGPRYYPMVALLNPDGSGTGTYTVDGLTYAYAASSYTVSTDSGSFSASSLTVSAQSRSLTTMTTSSSTDNLTWTRTST